MQAEDRVGGAGDAEDDGRSVVRQQRLRHPRLRRPVASGLRGARGEVLALRAKARAQPADETECGRLLAVSTAPSYPSATLFVRWCREPVVSHPRQQGYRTAARGAGSAASATAAALAAIIAPGADLAPIANWPFCCLRRRARWRSRAGGHSSWRRPSGPAQRGPSHPRDFFSALARGVCPKRTPSGRWDNASSRAAGSPNAFIPHRL